ncbi:MAG: branched-chain amino acid ABC transporter permease [Deltaproteobacteria bacterium]|nr:MAG: branched-chain amino acid ABC transporter permease [Deltaproteobacteria bacterium]
MGVLIYGTINSIYFALIAIGFALVYGISRQPNFAHGALYILAGFLTWTFLLKLGLNYPASIILSLIITAGIGAAVYRFLLIRVRGMEASEIIASFAIGLAIMEGLRFFGFRGKTYTLPAFLEGTVSIANVPVDFQRLIMTGIGVVLIAVLWLFTHHTKLGLALRAIAQDERAALMLGIDSDFTALIALALGSALAGLAAIAILPLGNITVETGYDILINAIAVCIIGGLGSWGGAVLASFILGFAQMLTVFLVGAQWQMVVALLAIIIILVARPSGLLARQKELEERV